MLNQLCNIDCFIPDTSFMIGVVFWEHIDTQNIIIVVVLCLVAFRAPMLLYTGECHICFNTKSLESRLGRSSFHPSDKTPGKLEAFDVGIKNHICPVGTKLSYRKSRFYHTGVHCDLFFSQAA